MWILLQVKPNKKQVVRAHNPTQMPEKLEGLIAAKVSNI